MQETFICRTDLGEIEIGRTILAHAVLAAIESMEGQVLATTKKGKVLAEVGRFSNTDAADCVEIEEADDSLRVYVHLAVRFGLSMKQITDTLAKKIRRNLQKEAGISPASVIIHVTGTVAKKIAPRDIEYRIDYED